MAESMSFLEAAQEVLAQAGKPLHYREITKRALAQSLIATQGKTPHESLNAQISVSIKTEGAESPFVRTDPGVFALRVWVGNGQVTEYDRATRVQPVRIASMPTYAQIAAVLPVWAGRSREEILHLHRSVQELTGSRDNPEDWSDPASWIAERLQGADQKLATEMWKVGVNPRYLSAPWSVATAYRLLAPSGEALQLTSDGRDFCSNPAGAAVRTVEEREGILKLLAILAKHAPAGSSDLERDWWQWLRQETTLASENTMRVALRSRLDYLRERGLVARTGRTYELTTQGRGRLGAPQASSEAPSAVTKQERKLLELIQEQKDQVREELLRRVSEMPWRAVERMVGDLLEALGYSDVEVTRSSHDKGVDVVATIEVGVTSVREVVQVKRMKANVQRPVLDALRGSLHRFEANRGMLITTGGFTAGTIEASIERGAAPITLIDGRRLVDLLIKNGIGIRKESVELWEIDESHFAAVPDDEDELEEADDE